MVVPREKRPGLCELDIVTVPPQLSVAVGAFQLTFALHEALAETVIFEGHPVIKGPELSLTMTLKVQVDVLPAASVAV